MKRFAFIAAILTLFLVLASADAGPFGRRFRNRPSCPSCRPHNPSNPNHPPLAPPDEPAVAPTDVPPPPGVEPPGKPTKPPEVVVSPPKPEPPSSPPAPDYGPQIKDLTTTVTSLAGSISKLSGTPRKTPRSVSPDTSLPLTPDWWYIVVYAKAPPIRGQAGFGNRFRLCFVLDEYYPKQSANNYNQCTRRNGHNGHSTRFIHGY